MAYLLVLAVATLVSSHYIRGKYIHLVYATYERRTKEACEATSPHRLIL